MAATASDEQPIKNHNPIKPKKLIVTKKILSAEALRRVWKAIKKSYSAQLVRDPVDLLDFEANLDPNLKQLEFILREGRYRPISPMIVRAAKRDGMTRPLSFLDITDTIVLKAITDAVQDLLHEGFPSCVGFARSQQKSFGETEEDYETWIQAWLRHQSVVKDLLEEKGCNWVVKSDISNFFPSISHKLLRQLVAQRTGVEEELINLLFFILESMIWRPVYSENLHIGLPQENFDASRILAHGFLYPVDKDFQKEIGDGRYARWVDDFVIVVSSPIEGRAVLRRLEDSLERRGLFPNSAKSKIVAAEDFAESLYSKLNEFLDEVHELTKAKVKKSYRQEFDKKAKTFLKTPPSKRLETWDRILRRFYTESRRIGSSCLEKVAVPHLRQFPSCASKILTYLLCRPYSSSIFDSVTGYLKSPDNIYEDVEILVYEFLLSWSLPSDSGSSLLIANLCHDHFYGRKGFNRPLTEHARGLISLMLYKFGKPDHIDDLAQYFFTNRVHDPAFARYALNVLAGTVSYRDKAFTQTSKFEDRSIRRLHSFLTAVYHDPKIYMSGLKQYVNVKKATPPRYIFFPARMLPLVRLVRFNYGFRKEWDKHLLTIIKRLRSGDKPLRDEKSIQWIEQILNNP